MASSVSSTTASAIDVASIVSQLMSVESQPLTALNTKEAGYQAKISAYGSVKSAVSTFQTAVGALNSPSVYSSLGATSSDTTVMTVSTTADAEAGTHSIEVLQLAQAQKLEATGQLTSTQAIGSGTLTFDFGTITDAATPTFNAATGKYGAGTTFTSNSATQSVVIDSSNNTLAGIRDAINNAGIGVTASIVNDGTATPYRLVLSSNAGGSTGSMKISVSGDPALANLLANDPSSATGQNMSEVATGQSAKVKVDGVLINRSSNQISDALPGTTLTLNKAGTASLDVSPDTSAIKTAVQGFVTGFNTMFDSLNKLTAYNASNGQAGVLQGDSSVMSMLNGIRRVMNTPIAGLTGDMTSLYQVGITFQKDGTLSLDSGVLQNAIANNPGGIEGVLSAMGKATDPQISYAGSSSATQPGTYPVNLSAVGADGSNASGTIDGMTADAASQMLTGGAGTGATGLQINILGGATGGRGTVTFTRGYADQLNNLLTSFLASDGVIASNTDGLNKNVKDITDQVSALNAQLTAKQAAYTQQFSSLNTLVSSMQSTSNFLTQQFAAMTAASK